MSTVIRVGSDERVREELIAALYERALPSTRTGALFNAHSYPTKINPEAIVPFILAHTDPGDVVYDGFAGSGTTGIAAALCDGPGGSLHDGVGRQGDAVRWGPRDAVLYDLSELATFIARTLLDPPAPDRFARAANELLAWLDGEWGWLYGANGCQGNSGAIRHALWTDHPICPQCSTEGMYWDLAVTLAPPEMATTVACPSCGERFAVATAARATETYWDGLLGRHSQRRKRTLAYLYGRSGRKTWQRRPEVADLALLERIEATVLPTGIPIVAMQGNESGRWGELHRAGYHYGMTHLHHFYTRRNLIAVAVAWDAAAGYSDDVREALRFWISSYNAAHSTLMTRVVCKKAGKDLVVTGAQPGALYVGSLPVEKNVFAGLRTKLGPITAAFAALHGHDSTISINCASSLRVSLPDESVDYIFTDPPFGDNIQYAEVNFISEAWLGQYTARADEAIVSGHQGKSLDDYHALLAAAFAENYRILRPGHYMTVVFHSTRPAVWEALRRAWEVAGFEMVRAAVLDKTQGSFKQVTTSGAVQGDPIILLKKPQLGGFKPDESRTEGRATCSDIDPWIVTEARLSLLDAQDDVAGRTRQRLYSHLITECLKRGRPVPLSARQFFAGIETHFVNRDGYYFVQS